MANLQLEHVTRRFGDVVAVDDLSLDFPDGRLTCLLGPSGCGKTTTLRMVAGLEVPDAGTIRIDGQDITHLEARQRHVGMMFQGYALYPHLSVKDNIGYPLRVRGTARSERERRVTQAAQMVGVGDLLSRGVTEISGGQAQRVALARAVVQRPAVFLLDEPISALDAAVRSRMRGEIKRLQRLIDTTTVIVSHDQLDALSMADVLVVMRDGVVQQVGPPTEVHDRPATAWVGSFIGEPQMNLLPGNLEDRNGELGIGLLGGWVALPADRRPDVARHADSRVRVGVRPVSVSVSPTASDDLIPAKVYAAQSQGTRMLYELDIEGTIVRAETGTDVALDVDSTAWLAVAPGGLQLFRNDEGGQRIA